MLTTIAGAGAGAGAAVGSATGGGLVAIVFPLTADPGPDPETTAAPTPGVPGAGTFLLVTGLVFVNGVIETDVAGVAVAVAAAPPIVTDDMLVVEETGDSHRRGASESSPSNPLPPLPDMLLLLGVVGGIMPVKEDVSPTEDPDPGLDPLYPPILPVLP